MKKILVLVFIFFVTNFVNICYSQKLLDFYGKNKYTVEKYLDNYCGFNNWKIKYEEEQDVYLYFLKYEGMQVSLCVKNNKCIYVFIIYRNKDEMKIIEKSFNNICKKIRGKWYFVVESTQLEVTCYNDKKNRMFVFE